MMKRILALISVLLILTSCNQEKNDFKEQWILHYFTYGKNYSFQKKQRTFFRNDSAISFSKLKNREISFPIKELDTIIIFKQLLTISDENNKNERDTIVIDTMHFDFKYILNKPILALKALKSSHIVILTCKNDKAIIHETNNFLHITNFKIGGLSIGDTIEPSSLTNIKDCEDCDEKGLIEANLKKNKNISLKLINKSIIYSLKQEKIEDNAIDNIIKVVSKKVNTKMDTIIKNPPFYTEGYSWSTEEIEIELSKNNMTQYYLDRAKESKETASGEYMRYYYLKLAKENISQNKYWTLKYDNLLLQSVLKYYQKKKPISTIIE